MPPNLSPDPPPRAEPGPSASAPGREDHDILMFPRDSVLPDWECYRIPVVKTGSNRGHYVNAPERWDLRDYGQRRAVGIAHLEIPRALQGGHGPGFAILPIKPEPAATSVATCYLINADNLTSPNLWTVEEWNDNPGGQTFEAPEHPDAFEVLIAGPWGKVFRLQISSPSRWDTVERTIKGEAGNELGKIQQLNLTHESEIWCQLRNGCVAGRVWFEHGHRIVPLVNVTALMPIHHAPTAPVTASAPAASAPATSAPATSAPAASAPATSAPAASAPATSAPAASAPATSAPAAQNQKGASQ